MANLVKTRNLILAGAACVAVAGITTAIAYGSAEPDSREDQASASANTNELTGGGAAGGQSADELRIEGESDGSFPLLFPRQLPPGTTAHLDFLGPIARNRDAKNGTWITTYFGGRQMTTDETVAGYDVYQDAVRPTKARCGGQQRVVRELAYAWVTICLGSNANDTAVDYWSTVDFTPRPEDLAWVD